MVEDHFYFEQHNYDTHDFHGRPVLLRQATLLEQDNSCADCKRPAPTYKVFEFNAEPWYWCGGCEIGG